MLLWATCSHKLLPTKRGIPPPLRATDLSLRPGAAVLLVKLASPSLHPTSTCRHLPTRRPTAADTCRLRRRPSGTGRVTVPERPVTCPRRPATALVT